MEIHVPLKLLSNGKMRRALIKEGIKRRRIEKDKIKLKK